MQVALGNRGRKEIKFVAPAEEKPTTRTFSGPEVRRMTMVALLMLLRRTFNINRTPLCDLKYMLEYDFLAKEVSQDLNKSSQMPTVAC